jgi:hypothetical protein
MLTQRAKSADFTDKRQGTWGMSVEYRTRSEILSPAPNTGSPGDRLYVGALTFGLHSHAAMGGVDISIGARSSTLEAQFLLLNRVRP